MKEQKSVAKWFKLTAKLLEHQAAIQSHKRKSPKYHGRKYAYMKRDSKELRDSAMRMRRISKTIKNLT